MAEDRSTRLGVAAAAAVQPAVQDRGFGGLAVPGVEAAGAGRIERCVEDVVRLLASRAERGAGYLGVQAERPFARPGHPSKEETGRPPPTVHELRDVLR